MAILGVVGWHMPLWVAVQSDVQSQKLKVPG